MGGGYCYAEKGHTYDRSYSRSYSSSWDYEPPKPKTQEEKDAELYADTKALPKRIPKETDSFSKWILDEGLKTKSGGGGFNIELAKDDKGNIHHFECDIGTFKNLQEIIKAMMELQNHFMTEYNKQKLKSWEGYPRDEPVYVIKMKGKYNAPTFTGDYGGKRIIQADEQRYEEKEFAQEVVYSSKSIGNMVSQTNTYGKHLEMEDINSHMQPENKKAPSKSKKYGLATPEKWLDLVNRGDKAGAIAGSRLTAECSRFELLHDNYDKVSEFSDDTNMLTIQNGYVMLANTQDLIQNIDKDSPITRKDILTAMCTRKGNDESPSVYKKSILSTFQEWKNVLPKSEDDKIIDTVKDTGVDTEEKHEILMKFILKNAKNLLTNTTEFSDDFFRNIIIDSKIQKELDNFLSLKLVQTRNFKKGKTDENTYGYWKGRCFQRSKDKKEIDGLNEEIIELREENEKLKVHYNSKEPEKFGVKAFTKDGEVYLSSAAGKETLDHELAHVYQQKTQNISATTEIGNQKVNLNPKCEKEADEIAENIHAMEMPKEETTQTQNIIQFAPPTDEDLQVIITTEARKLGIPADIIMQTVMDKAREYYQSNWTYSKSYFMPSAWGKGGYVNVCVIWALKATKQKTEDLFSKRIFDSMPYNNEFDKSLLNTITNANQRERIEKYVSKLIRCCDDLGIISALQGANINVTRSNTILDFKLENAEERRTNLFANRLELMATYIERVYLKFNKEYWIRSTGSDPHEKGQHALFLIDKKTNKISSVYKPHDMTADNAVVGKHGIFAKANRLIETDFIKKCQKLKLVVDGNKDALKTMKIDTDKHVEEFIVKKKEMSYEEAKLYFFRAGILKIITDAMAIIDLHADNIMPTEKHPAIIDAEINFSHYGIATQLSSALKTDEINGEPSNSTFMIKGGGEAGKDIKSGDAIKNTNSIYYKTYIEGFNFMKNQMISKKENFENIFKSNLNEVKKIRILPMPTGEFATYLQRTATNPEDTKKTVNDLKERIKNSFKEGFLDNRQVIVKFIDKDLCSAILKTFENTTIPAMYADMTGNIYLDNEKVGEIISKHGKKIHIGKKQMIHVMKECFKNIIESFRT